jgi:polyphenol oxidase
MRDDWVESDAAIAVVDELLGSVGLEHGQRKTLAGTWKGGQRIGKTGGAAVAQGAAKGRGKLESDPFPVVRAASMQKYGWLRHGFSTRAGGVSSVYGPRSLNLGWTKEDDPANVAENRRLFQAAVGTNAHRMALVGLRQSHSGIIRVVEAGDGALAGRLASAEGRPVLRGDGLMTDVPGILLGVGIADCVPVLVADIERRVVAAFHAGWRGTLARIVERGIGTMRLRYGSRPQDIVAAVGPAIGACCYAVGEELRFEFESQFAYAPELFSEVYDSDPVRDKYPLLFLTARAPGHSNIGPQIHLDLWEANRRQLVDAGVPAEQITLTGECTVCAELSGYGGKSKKYFSHRGESGFAGRMLGVVGMVG